MAEVRGTLVTTAAGTYFLLEFEDDPNNECVQHIKEVHNQNPNQVYHTGGNSDANRRESLRGIPTSKGLDRDEWPMAMMKEGGANAHVWPINPSDNRSIGSQVGNQLRGLDPNIPIHVGFF